MKKMSPRDCRTGGSVNPAKPNNRPVNTMADEPREKVLILIRPRQCPERTTARRRNIGLCKNSMTCWYWKVFHEAVMGHSYSFSMGKQARERAGKQKKPVRRRALRSGAGNEI